MEARCYSKNLVTFNWNTWCHIPEVSISNTLQHMITFFKSFYLLLNKIRNTRSTHYGTFLCNKELRVLC